MFGRSAEQRKSDQQALSVANLAAVEETVPGEHTACFNFEIYTKLGWIAWKEREASLYEKFNKQFKGKTLTAEIDKIHGIEPAICSWTDCKFGNLKKTHGSTLAQTNEKSSAENIRNRLEGLENCSSGRQREVDAIKEMYTNITKDITKKFNDLCHRIDMKVYEKCGSKFDVMESKIMKLLHEELTLLAMPCGFKHPPEGVHKRETGLSAVIEALQNEGDVIPDCEVPFPVPYNALSKDESVYGTRGSLFSNSQYMSSHSITPNRVKSPDAEHFPSPTKTPKRGATISEASKKKSVDKSSEIPQSPERRVTIDKPVPIERSRNTSTSASKESVDIERQSAMSKPKSVSASTSKESVEMERPSAFKKQYDSNSPRERKVTLEKKTSFKDTPVIIIPTDNNVESSLEGISDSNQMIKGTKKLHSPQPERRPSNMIYSDKSEKPDVDPKSEKLPALPKETSQTENQDGYAFSF
ncbi:hypothetical protein HDV01_001493 [Terramyces sp. JEL0728]|nr:hypothetical protein HDV01_001493 [Terramyces sp. JEL0728]